jgi:drug/metabolite transporter (DMT)-like permease
LLLNLEAPFTVLLAVTLFGEHLGRYAASAVVFVLLGAAMLGLESGALGADTIGVLMLAAACLCWALDNNLTQRLSVRDPFAIVRVKALVAGLVNTVLGLVVVGGALPSHASIVGALLLGSVSYGASIVLDTYALRWVGAAREAAYFATAPVVGVLVSIAYLGDTPRWVDAVAMACMAIGVTLLLRERHRH